ncbi:16S rRNA (uracil(1498)-N(3))-methyltransferase [Dethiothermospora halolimnae]|uniref:16S rRNA (uracil(1498)-N(3))-methyltransferase n=1 Tax=Dethiothermospora halolimnae TaxID=3114390 RepID=UPI003CCBABCB
MHRFFVDEEYIKEDTITIIEDNLKHIKNVLRLNIDDEILVCDGNKTEYICKIYSIDNKEVKVNIIGKRNSKSEPNIDITLYQGLPKASKMDLIVQKLTEIGVTRIVPIKTNRCVVKINNNKKEEKKLERWQKIIEGAAKQSGRGIIPKIDNIIDLDTMVNSFDEDSLTIVPYENEDKKGLKEVLQNFKGNKINIIIGPEGGFEEEEIRLLKGACGEIVSLGPRILRTETAGMITAGMVLYDLGDLGVI